LSTCRRLAMEEIQDLGISLDEAVAILVGLISPPP
jgi:hypothetical protein